MLKSPSGRIINGQTAKQNQFPYQAAIYIDTALTQAFCGGTLITDRYVLTSAHCLERFIIIIIYMYLLLFKKNCRALEVVVVLGALNLTDQNEPQHISISSTFILHEDYDYYEKINDIALIQLDKAVSFADNIQAISWASNDDLYVNSEGIASGWGKTNTDQQQNVDVLQYVKLRIIDNEQCKSIDPFQDVIKDTHLCTSGEGNVATCLGDSGGPLVVDETLVGVIAFGYKYCDAGKPSVYMRLTKYDSWIRQNIGT